jgi:Tfp pilus assembly protein PilZ
MGQDKPVQERRQSVRFRILSLVKHSTEPQGAAFQVANIQNVSRGGLTFFTGQEIKEGAILQLYFLPPNREKQVEARGKVVRCSPDGKTPKTLEVGIQFLDVSDEAARAILELEAFFLKNQKKIQA